MTGKYRKIGISLPPATFDLIRRQKVLTRRSVSKLIDEAIHHYFSEEIQEGELATLAREQRALVDHLSRQGLNQQVAANLEMHVLDRLEYLIALSEPADANTNETFLQRARQAARRASQRAGRLFVQAAEMVGKNKEHNALYAAGKVRGLLRRGATPVELQPVVPMLARLMAKGIQTPEVNDTEAA